MRCALQYRGSEDFDKLASYKEVHDKVVSLVQSNTKWSSDEMDCSYMGNLNQMDGGSWGSEVGQGFSWVDESQCPMCMGFGHYARECPSGSGSL